MAKSTIPPENAHTRHEIERKFLVRRNRLPPLSEGASILQGYLSRKPTVRVRIATKVGLEQGWLTVKGKGAILRPEYEYEIPPAEARAMLSMCLFTLEKVRYEIPHAGHTWEVDSFLGPHKGLWLAEIELESIDEKVALPEWVSTEVSEDPRYTNAALAESGRVP